MNIDESSYVWGRVSPEDASARLTHQHFLCTRLFGWLIHPAITASWPSENPPTSKYVADIACGNGIWATEVAGSRISTELQVVGFDIKDDLFPREEERLSNVKFVLWNAFEPPPKEYEATFDIVNLRLIFGAISNGDPRPILRNMLRLLKPGGYLQWLEYDFDHPVTIRDSPWCRIGEMFTHVRATHSNQWVVQLDEICKEEGLEEVEVRTVLPKKEMLKYWQDNWYIGLQEFVKGMANPKIDELWASCNEERAALGYYSAKTPIVFAVGRKCKEEV